MLFGRQPRPVPRGRLCAPSLPPLSKLLLHGAHPPSDRAGPVYQRLSAQRALRRPSGCARVLAAV